MPNITAIITAYRRPANILPLVQALRAQSVPAAAIWAWANSPTQKIKAILDQAKLDRVVTSSDNAYFHGRFALALLAPSEFAAIFDDDTIPGENWFANCLETMRRSPGILGTAGVVLHEAGYANRTMHGWQRPCDDITEVDLVGQGWFLRTEWVKHLFSSPAITRTNGEDIELAARAWRLAGIRSFCPPHPAGDKSRWGSTRGLELGLDEVAASRRVEHLAERKRIVEAEIAAGWRPLFMRDDSNRISESKSICGQAAPGWLPEALGDRQPGAAVPHGDQQPGAAVPHAGSAIADFEHQNRTELSCEPRWVTQYSYPLDNDAEHNLVSVGWEHSNSLLISFRLLPWSSRPLASRARLSRRSRVVGVGRVRMRCQWRIALPATKALQPSFLPIRASEKPLFISATASSATRSY